MSDALHTKRNRPGGPRFKLKYRDCEYAGKAKWRVRLLTEREVAELHYRIARLRGVAVGERELPAQRRAVV